MNADSDIPNPVFASSIFAVADEIAKNPPEEPQPWVLMDKVVARVMKHTMNKHGILRQALADELGLHISKFQKIEYGVHSTGWSLAMITATARFINIPASDILREIDIIIEDLRKDNILVLYKPSEATGEEYKLPE